MASKARRTFLQGAFILVAANLIVKIIGAIYSIPITNLLGEGGMGYYTSAYELYSFLFVLSTAGLPVAISKMVSESTALGRDDEAQRIFSVALVSFAIVGLVGSCAMYFGAGLFCKAINNNLAVYAVRMIAPAIFFVAIASAFRGFSQGMQNMMPTAISQVIEAICKLGVGIVAAMILLRENAEIYVTASGAIIGVTVGAALATLFLIGDYFRSPALRQLRSGRVQSPGTRSRAQLLKRLVYLAVPITIGASVMSLTNLLDLFVVMNRLGDIGYTQMQANDLFGSYSIARKLFNLPASLIFSLSISIMPVLSAAFAVHDTGAIQRNIRSALRVCLIAALPAGVGLVVLARPILNLLYSAQPNAVDQAAPLLATLSLAVACVCLVSLTNAMLQAIGLLKVPVITMLIGGTVKLIVNYTLIGTPSIGINGAPIGSVLCYTVITVLNLIILQRNVQLKLNFWQVLGKPLLASIGMGVCAIAGYNLTVGPLGMKLACLFAICAGGCAYVLLLLAVKGLGRAEIELLPKGRRLAAFLSRHNLLSD